VPMAELAKKAYALVDDMIMEFAKPTDDFKNLVLIGGIQINMPEPFNEYFLPLKFAVTSKKNRKMDGHSA